MDTVLERPVLSGCFNAISSKAEAHRALICSALSDTETHVSCRDINADIEATVRCLRALGADISRDDGGFTVVPIKNDARSATLDCGESGSTYRFLLPVAMTVCPECSFVLQGRLTKRPIDQLKEQLGSHGVRFEGENPLQCKGFLEGGNFSIASDVSSQFASGLLLALSRVGGTLRLVGKIESKPYIDMTLAVMRSFGVTAEDNTVYRIKKQVLHSPKVFSVGGDWSDAAFFLTAGVIGKKPICVRGLFSDSAQGDKSIVELLRQMDGRLEIENEAITAMPSNLHAIDIDASQIPDLVPVLSVAACCAQGTTRIYNAGRLRHKESDRLQSVCDMIKALGGDIAVVGDSLVITGTELSGGIVNNENDHRIVMSAAVASTVCNKSVTILGSETVKKSHPGFWEDFRRLSR